MRHIWQVSYCSDKVSICVENSLMTYIYKIVIRRWNQRLANDDQGHYRLKCVCNTSSLTLTGLSERFVLIFRLIYQPVN